MDKLYILKKCPASQQAMELVYEAPIMKRVEVSDVNFSNTPPSVTHVPTLIKQDGKMLVGAQVYRYLKKARMEPNFPNTQIKGEMFTGMITSTPFLVLVVVLIAAYFWQRNR